MSPPAQPQTSSDLARPRRIRGLVRKVCLVAAVLALWPLLPGAMTPALVPAFSPFAAVSTVLATRGFPLLVWLGLGMGLAVLVRRRLFCRWLCPVGLGMDGVSRLGQRFGRRGARFPRLGPWIVLLTLGGACLGYPLLLWLDPLARFAGFFALRDNSLTLGAVLSLLVFLAMLALSFLWPNAWCGRACPLGAFQDLLFVLPRSFRSVIRREPPGAQEMPLPRRMVLGAVAGAGVVGATRFFHGQASRPLRPPGALDDPAFSGLCTRCGNCVRVCPSGIIERDVGEGGWAALLTPVLSFRKDYCREDCVRCTEVCPSGALVRLPTERKPGIQLGLPRVDMDVCLLGDDRECSLCRSRCPYGAIRYVFSETDYTLTPQIDPGQCNGCGACEAACPTKPRKAIIVLPV